MNLSSNFADLLLAATGILSLHAQTTSESTCNVRPLEFQQVKENSAAILLITSKELAPAWEKFIQWKTASGLPVSLKTTAQISKEYKGKDLQEKMRHCALDFSKNKGTRWVILGGDSGKGAPLPHRETPHSIMGGRMAYNDIPTDIYFISDKSWDADGDGIYGEWKDDKEQISYCNSFGSVIGRIPVRSAEDVLNYTDKVIAYESHYPQKDFANKMMYTNTVIHSKPKVVRSWNDYVSKNWQGGKVTRFFHDKTPWDKEKPGDYQLTPMSWAKAINTSSASKMHMHGHGLQHGWALENHQMAKASTVKQLKNKNAFLLMTTVSCFTGQFDSGKDPAISESMLRAKDAGAIMVITPAREGVPIFHNPKVDFPLMMSEGKLDGTTESMTRFWVNGLSEHKQGKTWLSAGEAWQQSRMQMSPHAKKTSGYHWCQCELNFLGDPSIDMRARNPRTPQLRSKGELNSGKTSKLQVATGIPGARVCLWKQNDIYEVVLADAKGVATFAAVNCKSKGKARLTIAGANINTVSKQILVK